MSFSRLSRMSAAGSEASCRSIVLSEQPRNSVRSSRAERIETRSIRTRENTVSRRSVWSNVQPERFSIAPVVGPATCKCRSEAPVRLNPVRVRPGACRSLAARQ